MPNYRRFYSANTPVFVTVVTQSRRPWLLQHPELVLNSMRNVKQHYAFRYIAHVILTDHLHWIFEPKDENNFSKILAAFKRDVSWALKSISVSEKWQKRFYDHVIRDESDFMKHLDYVHYNPVKHGLVINPFDHKYSLIHEWKKRGVYSEDWGVMVPEGIIEMNLE